MTTALLFDMGLCVLVLVAALSAVLGRDLFGSVAFFIAYGLLIALAWIRLGAVDVALAEAAIGAGLTGVLLISGWAILDRRGVRDASSTTPGALKAFVALASVGVSANLALAVLELPQDAAGLIPVVAENLGISGASNPVTAVLLNFRAYDTLLESIVLVAALVAIWSLTPGELWGGLPGLRQHARSDGVLATFGRLLPPLGLLVGVYLVWAGTSMPGGAFQAATVLAAVWLLIVMSGIRDEPPVSSLTLRAAIVAGPSLFLGVGAAGTLFGVFLGFPAGLATGLILAIEYALTPSLAITLALLVAGVPRRPA